MSHGSLTERALAAYAVVADNGSVTVPLVLTFMFTDVEGSTRLWEVAPEAMEVALARHDEILAAAIEGEGGSVFKTVGDAFCAVFQSPAEAAAAAARSQLALARERWPEPIVLNVRVALHTGACTARGADYFGPTVNRVARLLGVVHGKQTVLSAACADQARECLPAGAELRDLGEHWLKDLGVPEHVYQLNVDQLPTEFPPLLSLGNPRMQHNLPLRISTFIGREKELAELTVLLDESRLVTLTGTGGSGKTTLALHAAAELVDGSADGVWLAELASLSEPEEVVLAVAAALGMRTGSAGRVEDLLVDWLYDRRLLLVLDNCEHLLASCAGLVDRLLRSCPDVWVLATSREPLGLEGEHVYRVPSLDVPGVDVPALQVEAFPAVRLFVERAQSQQPGFAIDESNAASVVSICRRLDGIPLAIELAAVRLRSMSVADLDGRLDDRFRLLTGGSRSGLPHHQTLRALIDWSYDRMTPTERVVLCRASIFARGFSLEAAESICATREVSPDSVMDLLASLVDKSLIQVDIRPGSTRYSLLETIREYATKRHEADDTARAIPVAEAHALFFLGLAEAAQPQLTGSDQASWFARLEIEHENLRRAIRHALDAERGPEMAYRFVAALRLFWLVNGHMLDGAETAEAALQLDSRREPTALRATALIIAGQFPSVTMSAAARQSGVEEGLQIAYELGDPRLICHALGRLSDVLYRQGSIDAAIQRADEAVSYANRTDDAWWMGWTLNLRALFSHSRDPNRARDDYQQATAHATQIGDHQLRCGFLCNLAYLELQLGDASSAGTHLEQALKIAQDFDIRNNLAFIWNNLGLAAALRGDHEGAWKASAEALRVSRRNGDLPTLAETFHGLADAAAVADNVRLAAQLYGAAAAMREKLGTTMEPFDAELYRRQSERLGEVLGPDLELLYDQGRRRNLAEIAALVSGDAEVSSDVQRIEFQD